ncbi:MAG: tetratricopeptide repeat protein [Oceanipulchritudo sp.]
MFILLNHTRSWLRFGGLLLMGLCPAYAQIGSVQSSPSFLLPEQISESSQLEELRKNWEMRAIRSALRNGFIPVARTLVNRLLERDLPEDERTDLLQYQLQVALVEGDLESAGRTIRTLEESGEGPDPLLQGMFLFFSGATTEARSVLAEIDPEEMSASARGWFRLMQALDLSRQGDVEAANIAFYQAERLAPTALLRDHFEIVRLRDELHRGAFSEEGISALRGSVRSMRGERSGFEAARLLVIALNRSGEKDQAIEMLNEHLSLPGLKELGYRPAFLLLMGMIAGADSSRGRLALRQLVSEAEGGETLETAFSLLVQSLSSESDRLAFLEDIEGWLEADSEHPLRDRLLVHQAHLLQIQGLPEEAEESAKQLLDSFPDSEYVPVALGLLARISWNQTPPRYRTAADYLNQLRPYLTSDAELLANRVQVADCYFLNEDYARASEAYAAVLSDAPRDLAGSVFFQRILAEMGADRPEMAARYIDEAYADPRLELSWIWKAEWNLLDHLRRKNATEAAFERVETVLERDYEERDVPPSLLLRMEWVSARLSLEADEPGLAESKAAALRTDLESGYYAGIDQALIDELQSHLLLLTGEALFAQDEEESGREAFRSLREQYSQSGPAILSYLVESRAESDEDNLVSAQQSLISLVDRFPESEFAPIALWEAALNAEQRGLLVHLQEAIGLLERLATEYPENSLVYFARLKQGDLARRLNDFSTALLLYERLLTRYPGHPQRYRAEISRADCLMALGSEDPTRYDVAAILYERTCLLSAAPLPVRMEAGFKWAHSLEQQGDAEGSESVLWLLFERFVLDPDLNQPILISEAGRYWMARSLLELANIQVQRGETAAAARVFERILRLELPGSAVAAARLETLR